jgi:glutathione peroxidase
MSFYNFIVRKANGAAQPLKDYEGQVVLVVNVASQCGFTPQYKGLQEAFEKYRDRQFTILGFPCNQFGGQEPGANDEIQSFCQVNFGVQFPVMGKIEVNGAEADPLYKWLKSEAPGLLGTQFIKWNFTKFLIGKQGQVLARFGPKTPPSKLSGPIEAALA